jgi:hypothetical protein
VRASRVAFPSCVHVSEWSTILPSVPASFGKEEEEEIILVRGCTTRGQFRFRTVRNGADRSQQLSSTSSTSSLHHASFIGEEYGPLCMDID